MAYAGQVIENPLSGERITFHLTAAQTDGERVVIDLEVAAGGRMPAGLHVHPEPVRVEIRPALAMERLLETAAALAREGRACANGMPKPLDLALFVREAQAAFPPPWAQRIAIAPLAWIAERRGYGPLPRRSGARLSDGSVPVVHHRRCRPSRTRRTRGEQRLQRCYSSVVASVWPVQRQTTGMDDLEELLWERPTRLLCRANASAIADRRAGRWLAARGRFVRFVSRPILR
jgi:hypothetical protein